MSETAGNAAGAVGDAASGAGSAMVNAPGQAAGMAGDAASGTYNAAGNAAGAVGDGAAAGAERGAARRDGPAVGRCERPGPDGRDRPDDPTPAFRAVWPVCLCMTSLYCIFPPTIALACFFYCNQLAMTLISV